MVGISVTISFPYNAGFIVVDVYNKVLIFFLSQLSQDEIALLFKIYRKQYLKKQP